MAVRTRAAFQGIYPGRSVGLSGLASGTPVPEDWNDVFDSVVMDEDISAFGRTLIDDLSAAAARATLGGTTVGQSFFALTNPSAVTFPRINADNSVSALSASAMLSAIGGVDGSAYLPLAGGTMSGDITLKSGSVLTDYANGKVVVSGTTPMLALGGVSSAYPAIKRSSAVLEARLADDSGYAQVNTAMLKSFDSLVGTFDSGAALWGPLLSCAQFLHGKGLNFRNVDKVMWSDGGSLEGTVDVVLDRIASQILRLYGTGTTVGASLEMHEMSAPAAPGADGVRLYADNGGVGGKSRLLAIFQSGAAQVVALEP